MTLDMAFKKMVPALALAALGVLAGCKNANFAINGVEGVPLAELDMSGDPPDSLVLAGPDNVVIADGSKLAITVDGDDEIASHLRFHLDDGTLGISRDNVDFSSNSRATVLVTMPPPKSLTMAGSGTVTSARLADEAEVTIAGSGTIETPGVAAAKLDVTIAGSGGYKAAGTVQTLNLTIAGSGSAKMEGLKVDTADLSIAGSGDTMFASDGTVDASIMGSGNVTVRGSARCELSSLGSGKLHCERGTQSSDG